MAEKKDPPYFMYFPGNYRWSAGFINMLGSGPYGGSDIGELHKIGALLKGKSARRSSKSRRFARSTSATVGFSGTGGRTREGA